MKRHVAAGRGNKKYLFESYDVVDDESLTDKMEHNELFQSCFFSSPCFPLKGALAGGDARS